MVLDLVDGTVFGARDRFGVKPLFYYQSDKYLLIASEIKAIRRSGLYHGGIDGDAAARFMANDELDVGAGTFFEGIRRIAAGHQFEIGRDGILRTASYWTLPSRAYAGHADPVERFTEIIDDAIRIRMRSDVPVGILLSGGLDSTSILCRAVGQAGANGGSMHAFSYMPEQYQEHQQISDTIAATGAILHRLDSDPLRMWSAIEPMLRAQDEPVHSMTAVVHYRLMQAAREHGIKVVLVGQGADESLAGYPNYFNAYHSALLRQGKIGRLWAELGAFIDTHGGNRGERLISHARSALMGLVSNLAVYRGLSEARREQRMLLGGWLVSDVVRRAKPRAVPPPGMDLRAELAYSMEVTSLPLYLRIEDRNSMAHSIEARLPFMDYRLVSFAFELADEWKLRGGWNKFILREAMRGRIPESVRTRPGKLGFPTPVDAWMRGALAEPVREVLTDPSLARRGLYRPGVIEEGLRRHIAGEADLGARLFDVVQFELWQQIIEREPVSALAA